MSSILIGTSGWSYNHWVGNFYPNNLSKWKWLEFYTEQFNTVELNTTFYRLPMEKTFQNWYRRTPNGFVFSVKMSRYITHIKKLRECDDNISIFFDRIKELKEKCPIILIQLPPSLEFKRNVAENFMDGLTSSHGNYRYTIECRNLSWFSEDSYRLMSKYGIALCFADTPRYPYEEKETADFIYIRLHGHEVLYASDYSKEQLETWANKINGWLDNGMDVYVYFDNDAYAYAPKNAKMLKDILKRMK